MSDGDHQTELLGAYAIGVLDGPEFTAVQTHLHGCGLCQRELDDLRRAYAERRLRDESATLAEIAHAVGFADQSAFHKAFVRWTGTTPGEFRRAGK